MFTPTFKKKCKQQQKHKGWIISQWLKWDIGVTMTALENKADNSHKGKNGKRILFCQNHYNEHWTSGASWTIGAGKFPFISGSQREQFIGSTNVQL